MKLRKTTGALAAGALVILSATSAYADIVANAIDGNIDAEHESITLYLSPGAPGETTLDLVPTDEGDHPGCNIQGGGPQYLAVTAAYDLSVVDVDLSNGGVFDNCDTDIVVTVTPLAVGATDVVFSYASNVSNDPRMQFDVSGADFTVNVLPADEGGGNGEVCDADPAAPAWAAALLKGNDWKPRGRNAPNYVAMVADEMGPRATFAGYEKSEHPEYENAVWNFMKVEFELDLPDGPSEVARPGWECTPVPTL